jgi:hypothetical protein
MPMGRHLTLGQASPNLLVPDAPTLLEDLYTLHGPEKQTSKLY